MSTPQPSLRQIAKKAGVSHVTVSLALRNHRSIPAKTTARIHKIADEMGYKRDPELSKLMARIRETRPADYQGTLAWLTAWPTRDGWKKWLAYEREFLGAETRASALGYQLEPFWYSDPKCSPDRLASILIGRGIEGVIVAPLPDGRYQLDFRWDEFACASVGLSLHEPRFHSAESAHWHNIAAIMESVRSRGYHRLGMLLSLDMDERVMHCWSGVYLSDQERLPASDRVPLLQAKEITKPLFQKWMRKYKPDVILANQYDIVGWLADMGLKVPQDIAHARMDTHPLDLPLEKLVWTPDPIHHSGMDQLPEIVGAAAVDTVVAQIHRNERGVPEHPQIIQVQGVWLDGDTLLERGHSCPAES